MQLGADPQRHRRRHRFDEVADLYARARPGYPEQLFADLWTLADLDSGPRVLEIGCGTGQATVPMLRRGARVVAIELGPRLADLARAATHSYGSKATILQADFDTWTPALGPFDLALAATAFDWLEPQTRCARIARALRERGWLAIVSNEHVSDEAGDVFHRLSQPAYREAFGTHGPPLRVADEFEPVALAADQFQVVERRKYRWVQAFDSTSYLEVLATYSDHRDIAQPIRDRLFSRLAKLIGESMGGRIEKHWVACLTLARRRR